MAGVLTALYGSTYLSTATSYIKSIQQVSITIGSGATSNTATITSVDTTKAWVIFLGETSTTVSSDNNRYDFCRVELTNATTVTAYRDTSNTGSVTVNAFIVEATSNLVTNIRAGTISLSGASTGTATISSVVTSRSAVFYLGMTTNATGTTPATAIGGVTLTNSTTVTANAATGVTGVVGFIVVEFAAAAIQSVQQFANAYTTSNTTDTQTITSVVQNNSMIAWGGGIFNSTSNWEEPYSIQLTSSTNVNLVRQSGNTSTRTPYYTVIEFASGVLNSAVQRGILTIAAGNTSNTASISSINTSKGFANYVGGPTFSGTGTGGVTDTINSMTLTNATTITLQRATSNASRSSAAGYEAVEFK